MAAHAHWKQLSFWGLLKYHHILNSRDSCIYRFSAGFLSFLKKYKITHKVSKKFTLQYPNCSNKESPSLYFFFSNLLFLPIYTPLIRSVNCRHLTKLLPQNLWRFYYKLKLVHQYAQTSPVQSIFLRNCIMEVPKNYRFLFPCFARNYVLISQI